MQLHRPDILRRLEDLDGSYRVVSFAAPERLRAWVPWFRKELLVPAIGDEPGGSHFERTVFLSDASLAAYSAYGLGRLPILKVWRPGIIRQYLRWALQGKRIRRSPEDKLQQGGDYVVAADGRLAYAHPGADPSDRPDAELLLAKCAAVNLED